MYIVDHGHSHGGHSHSHSSSADHSHGNVGAIRLPEDDEETAENLSEEEIDDLYAHPAQTRANIVRAALQKSGHNRRRSNSTNVDN